MNAKMSDKGPIGDVLGAVLPFLAGTVLGGIVTGWVICFNLRTYVIGIADTPASPFDAFLIWMLFGMSATLVASMFWIVMAITLVWILCPWPLGLRPWQFIVALGAVASTSVAIAGPLDRDYDLGMAAIVIAVLPTMVAPLLMVTRRAPGADSAKPPS